MKTPLTLLSFLACLGLASAACCGDQSCEGKNCEATTCEKSCDGESCSVADAPNTVYVAVEGMSCGACSGKITDTLAAMDGVTVKKVCHKSGSAKVVINPETTNHDAVVKAINGSGFKVVGDIVSMKVDGMTCGACSSKLSTALAGVEGVSVRKVCHKAGMATIVMTDKASKQAVMDTIASSGFTVAK